MKILLAVSGGIDSMTMADIMFSHSCLYDDIAIAHCNFHLRPGDCDLDEQLVEEWSRARALTFYKKDFDTESYSREHGVSIEMAARDLRYAWFADLCRTHGFDAVAVAHNANDNAETLLLNLVRGTGLRGTTGMPASRSFESADSLSAQPSFSAASGEIAIIRPLLGMTRAEIEKYAAEHNVPYRTDKTNLECEYKRNRIRNQVMPVLEEMNPSVVRTLNRDMAHLSAASAIIDDWCAEHRQAVTKTSSTPGVIEEISLPALLSLKHWEYLLHDIMDSYGFTPSGVADVTRLIAASANETFSGKTFLARSYKLLTASDSLIIMPVSSDSLVFKPNSGAAADLASKGVDVEFSTFEYVPGMDLKCERGVLLYDAEKVPSDAVVRPWQAGDWFVPFGMKGRKKLSDFFTDLHLSLAEKSAILVLAPASTSAQQAQTFDCEQTAGKQPSTPDLPASVTQAFAPGQRVYAVLGYRIDDAIRVTSTTRLITRCALR